MAALIMLVARTSIAQDSAVNLKKSTTANAITSLVESKHFVFVPETVSPIGAASRSLNGEYDLVIAGDTLISTLPYFGRAYSAPANPSEGPLRFTTTNFDYKTNPRRRGGWDIQIKPKGVNVQQMNLFIYENGFASVQVTSNNRQPISFSGHIEEIKKRK
jgi:hypothetical protein